MKPVIESKRTSGPMVHQVAIDRADVGSSHSVVFMISPLASYLIAANHDPIGHETDQYDIPRVDRILCEAMEMRSRDRSLASTVWV